MIVLALAGAAVAITATTAHWHTQEAASSVTSTADPSLAVPAVTGAEQIKAIKQLIKRDATDPQATGSADAPVVMLEFSDFSCPMCSNFAVEKFPQLQKYVDAGVLRTEYHDFVIFADKYHSDLGARAAWAAGQQGKFWEFYAEAMPKSLPDHFTWTEDAVTEIAQTIGIADMEKFTADLLSPAALQSIQGNTMLAMQIGFTGTPGFIINNRLIGGNADVDTFAATIEAAAADAAAGKF